MRETASKSGLLLSGCLRWAHPAARWYSDRPDDAQAREDGKAFHHALDLHAQGLPASYPQAVADKVRVAREYYDKKLLPRCEEIHTEVAMGINFKTGEAVGLASSDRNYPEDDDYFYGTADIVAILKSGKLLIADWKTGGSDGADEQLKTLALMALRIFQNTSEKVTDCRIAVLSVSDDEVMVHEREVPLAELQSHYNSVRDAIAKSRATAKPSLPVVGTHCTQMYCPHLAKCPATFKDASRMLEGALGSGKVTDGGPPPKEYEFTEQPEGERHAGWMAMRMRAIKRAMTYYDGCLKDHARSGNRVMYDGYEWAEGGAGFRWKKL